MASEAYTFQARGLAKLISMMPSGGYTGCGDDLYVVATNIASGAVTSSHADMPLTTAIDTTASMYELSVTSHYYVWPLINLSSVPLLGDVPGLGQPVNLTFTVNRPIEHPAGLMSSSANGSGTSGGTVTPFVRITNGNLPIAGAGTWRNPSIYNQILAAGETVVSENVILVKANNPNWTPTNIVVSPREKIWIDTQAVGLWQNTVSETPYDANGFIPQLPNASATVPTIAVGTLDGIIGPPSGTPFLLGDQRFNYPPPGSSSGNLAMIFNDMVGCYSDNLGAQKVRVIVTN